MSGETNFNTLLHSIKPELSIEEYVFCTVESSDNFLFSRIAGNDPVWAIIREKEALTLIMERSAADTFLFPYEAVFRRITLTVHSSLNAVGLTAAISDCLASAGISANVVAAFYHDHIFVPSEKAIDAVRELTLLSGGTL